MGNTDLADAAAAAGTAMEQAVAIFMLHPENFGASVAAGYENPLAGYVAGRGGVLGEATGVTVSAVFAVSPHWGRRSSPRHRSRVCRCSPAGGRCRWPTMPRPGRCR